MSSKKSVAGKSPTALCDVESFSIFVIINKIVFAK